VFRGDRTELAETVADEVEATFEQRLAWGGTSRGGRRSLGAAREKKH